MAHLNIFFWLRGWLSLIVVLHCPHYTFSKFFKPFYSIFFIAVLIMQSTNSVTTARFDYYRLSETWLGTYCRSNPCHKHTKHDRFSIHRLWLNNYKTPPSQKKKKNIWRGKFQNRLWNSISNFWISFLDLDLRHLLLYIDSMGSILNLFSMIY